jgi:hypothetical protein
MTQKIPISRGKKDQVQKFRPGKPDPDVLQHEGEEAAQKVHQFKGNLKLPIYCINNPKCYRKFVKPNLVGAQQLTLNT